MHVVCNQEVSGREPADPSRASSLSCLVRVANIEALTSWLTVFDVGIAARLTGPIEFLRDTQTGTQSMLINLISRDENPRALDLISPGNPILFRANQPDWISPARFITTNRLIIDCYLCPALQTAFLSTPWLSARPSLSTVIAAVSLLFIIDSS